jgi:hypothetical protein
VASHLELSREVKVKAAQVLDVVDVPSISRIVAPRHAGQHLRLNVPHEFFGIAPKKTLQ